MGELSYGVADGVTTGVGTATTFPFLVVGADTGEGSGSGSTMSEHSGNVRLKKVCNTGCATGQKKLNERVKKLKILAKNCASAGPIDASNTKAAIRKRRGMNIMVEGKCCFLFFFSCIDVDRNGFMTSW